MYTIRINEDHWFCIGNTYVIGAMIYEDKILKGRELCEFIHSQVLTDLDQIVRKADGFFSIIEQREEMTWVFVDHLSVYSVFINETEKIISDQILFCDIANSGINSDVFNQYRSAFFSFGTSTFANGWKRVQGGTYWCLADQEVYVEKYWTYRYNDEEITDRKDAVAVLHKAFDAMAKKFIAQLDGRTVVLPLSGGHDSRILLYLLVKNGYRNIVTYTYGVSGYQECSASKKTADALGVPWIFVKYIPKKMKKLFDSDFLLFSEFTANASSIPQLQDWYAVDFITRNNLVPRDSVFVPGHTGDLLSGDYFTDIHMLQEPITTNDILNALINRHLTNLRRFSVQDAKRWLTENCPYLIDNSAPIAKKQAEELFERFNWEERQAKYILNSMRCYTYYGYDILCPLNYRSQFEAYAGISNELRFKRDIYFEFERELYRGTVLENVDYVRLHAHKKSRVKKFAEKIICGPMKQHYMFGYYNFSYCKYLKLVFSRQLKDVNFFIQDSYVAQISNAQEGDL